VYEAEDVENGRRIALKVLSSQLAGEDDRARFLREGRLAASVSHPGAVYIFGSDEIEGTPVIAMELVPGGTLKDSVESTGPLDPRAAVDSILQVIAGLEAAHAVGVLHRDIKPANCFVSQAGVVKIGDFGLSISTMSRDTTRLTMTGAFQGTPAFASPEQLWGHPLDLRSDIYSVGATLHFLLTGKPPFDDQNIMALLRQIEGTAPPPISASRPEVPRGLSAVVLRCLEKQPGERYRDYAALTEALAPYARLAATPKVLGRRFAANLVDVFILTALALPARTALELVVSKAPAALLGDLIGVAYFTLAEGKLGMSIGKAALGLRVVGPDGGDPGLLRAFVRAVIYLLLGNANQIATVVGAPAVILARFGSVFGTLLPFLMFVTARARNRFASAYDLLTNTRVVMARDVVPRAQAVEAPRLPQASEWTARVGTFRVEQAPTAPTGSMPRVVKGFDDRLSRIVWIALWPLGTRPIASARRDLALRGRPRWLGGRRTSEIEWDAFEAVEGRPLSELADPQPWAVVRSWLRDIAGSLASESGDSTLCSLDRVWISGVGRAWVLDWPVHAMAGTGAGAALPPERRLAPGEFLVQVASAGTKSDYPLPLRDETLLRSMEKQQSAFSELPATVAKLATGRSRVSAAWRVSHLALMVFIPVVFGTALGTRAALRETALKLRPEVAEFAFLLAELESLERLAATDSARRRRDAIRVHIRANYAPIVRAHAEGRDAPGTSLVFEGWTSRWRLADRTIASGPSPSAAEAADARKEIGELSRERFARPSALVDLVALPATLVMLCAPIALLTAYLAHGGIAYRWLGLAIVTREGNPISAYRAAFRAVLGWAPAVLSALALFTGLAQREVFRFTVDPLGATTRILKPENAGEGVLALALSAVFAIVWCAGAVAAARRPERGWQDRIAGTWIVPR
jgi:uncharacterized RDD family membrane protein YckC